MIAEIRRGINQAVEFVREGIWDTNPAALPFGFSLLVRTLRVLILMVRGIKDDELLHRASALTYITLVSIVPMLSIAMAVSKGLGYDQYVLGRIAEFAQTQPENVQQMLGEIIKLVENTNFQSLGWIGVAFLIVTATLVLNGLEKTLNRIWGISTSRNMLRRIANYISLLFVVPIFIGVAGTLQGFAISSDPNVGNFFSFLTDYMPFISTMLALSLLYVMLPNTKVGWLPAFISGLCGAIVWIFWQKVFINLQLSVVKYNAIYGTFASLPIFLVWLHTSWLIILLGAEVGFAVQYHNTLHLERGGVGGSMRVRQLLALSILAANADVFKRGGGHFDKTSYADQHKVPIRLVNDVIKVLEEAGLLLPISEQENCYALGRAPEAVSIKRVLDLLDDAGKGADELGLEDLRSGVGGLLDISDRAAGDALAGRTLSDLLAPLESEQA
jgi:membrane protein